MDPEDGVLRGQSAYGDQACGAIAFPRREQM